MDLSMITIRELEKRYSFLKEDLLNILLEIHNIVAEIAPDASLDMAGNSLVYFYGSRGGHVSAGICLTTAKPDHIRLGFIHGAYLPDPLHLLEGKTFPMRFMRIRSFDTAPWDEIRQLILAHSQLDPYNLPPVPPVFD